MLITQDMRDLIALLEQHHVQYVLVGGFAVNYYVSAHSNVLPD